MSRRRGYVVTAHSLKRDVRSHELTNVADVTPDQAPKRASIAPLQFRSSAAQRSAPYQRHHPVSSARLPPRRLLSSEADVLLARDCEVTAGGWTLVREAVGHPDARDPVYICFNSMFDVGASVGTRELLEQALKLDPTERLELVDRVLHSLDRPDPAIDSVWIEEAERRLNAYRAGKVRGISAEDVVGPF